jgi:hypothetical protein
MVFVFDEHLVFEVDGVEEAGYAGEGRDGLKIGGIFEVM